MLVRVDQPKVDCLFFYIASCDLTQYFMRQLYVTSYFVLFYPPSFGFRGTLYLTQDSDYPFVQMDQVEGKKWEMIL